MNKQLLQTTIILIFTLFTTMIFAQKKLKYDEFYLDSFPTYQEIIEMYFTENEYDLIKVFDIQFGKKYDGWYVILRDENNGFKERLIWDSKTQQFKNVKTKGKDKGSPMAILQAKHHFLNDYEAAFFEQYPIYGYYDYESDLINLLENEKDLSAHLLDALARSYSSKARQILTPGQFGWNKKIMEYDRTFNPEDWDKDVLNTFMQTIDKSIATFKILADKYPNYQTVVGNIHTKYQNEYMSAYYVLKYSGKPKLAEKYLVDDLYNDFQIKTAINALKTCANNAILFTSGDNDTYPLIYVQDKLGIRTDVKLINISLANLGRYINFIKNEYNLPTILSIDEYRLDNNNYILIKNEIEDVDLRDYFKALNEDKNIFFDEIAKVHYLPATQGFFVIQDKLLSNELRESKQLSESVARFDFGKKYLIKGEILILDLITTDNWLTPIYFSNGGYNTIRNLGMLDYVKVEGLAYRFLPKGTHDITLLENNIFNNLEFPKTEGIDWYSSDNYWHLYSYQMAFKELLEYRKNNKTEVEKILAKMEVVFPHSMISYNFWTGDFANFCYDTGLTERGDAFIRNEAKHIHNYFKRLKNKEDLSLYDKQTVKIILNTANQLVTIAEINERDAFESLAEEFQPYLEKYGK